MTQSTTPVLFSALSTLHFTSWESCMTCRSSRAACSFPCVFGSHYLKCPILNPPPTSTFWLTPTHLSKHVSSFISSRKLLLTFLTYVWFLSQCPPTHHSTYHLLTKTSFISPICAISSGTKSLVQSKCSKTSCWIEINQHIMKVIDNNIKF